VDQGEKGLRGAREKEDGKPKTCMVSSCLSCGSRFPVLRDSPGQSATGTANPKKIIGLTIPTPLPKQSNPPIRTFNLQLRAVLYLPDAYALHVDDLRYPGDRSESQRISQGTIYQDRVVFSGDVGLLGVTCSIRHHMEAVDFPGGVPGPEEDEEPNFPGKLDIHYFRVQCRTVAR